MPMCNSDSDSGNGKNIAPYCIREKCKKYTLTIHGLEPCGYFFSGLYCSRPEGPILIPGYPGPKTAIPNPPPCDWPGQDKKEQEDTKNIFYKSLKNIMDEAYSQARNGKGHIRHSSGEPFEKQPICQISRMLSPDFALGQAIKKILESQRLYKEDGVFELLGAINYIAGAIIVLREGYDEK